MKSKVLVSSIIQMKLYSLIERVRRLMVAGLWCVQASVLCSSLSYSQTKLLIPMDLKQTDHLKSYGVAFWLLEHNGEVDWLLNYRGGSFLCDYTDVLA